ncbi:uncharacterized protein LOC108097046 [Drosophila ficusphila]|uniref:uncharacterized protein LOC108097046 n=1 Tax=Drosophila ficusphila TaxID=30025 RepID=UPI0007E67724|nr:uncharacterized protein LOC108097046 [Drosophila ficusphila]
MNRCGVEESKTLSRRCAPSKIPVSIKNRSFRRCKASAGNLGRSSAPVESLGSKIFEKSEPKGICPSPPQRECILDDSKGSNPSKLNCFPPVVSHQTSKSESNVALREELINPTSKENVEETEHPKSNFATPKNKHKDVDSRSSCSQSQPIKDEGFENPGSNTSSTTRGPQPDSARSKGSEKSGKSILECEIHQIFRSKGLRSSTETSQSGISRPSTEHTSPSATCGSSKLETSSGNLRSQSRKSSSYKEESSRSKAEQSSETEKWFSYIKKLENSVTEASHLVNASMGRVPKNTPDQLSSKEKVSKNQRGARKESLFLGQLDSGSEDHVPPNECLEESDDSRFYRQMIGVFSAGETLLRTFIKQKAIEMSQRRHEMFPLVARKEKNAWRQPNEREGQ